MTVYLLSYRVIHQSCIRATVSISILFRYSFLRKCQLSRLYIYIYIVSLTNRMTQCFFFTIYLWYDDSYFLFQMERREGEKLVTFFHPAHIIPFPHHGSMFLRPSEMILYNPSPKNGNQPSVNFSVHDPPLSQRNLPRARCIVGDSYVAPDGRMVLSLSLSLCVCARSKVSRRHCSATTYDT